MRRLQQRAISLTKQGYIRHPQRADCFTMIAAGQTNKLLLGRLPLITPCMKTHLQRNLDGRGAIGRIKAMPQHATSARRELLRKRNHRLMREARQHHMRQAIKLIF